MNFLPVLSILEPEQLDTMLAFGYYRMQQSLFTTNFAHTDDRSRISVIWARVLLIDFEQNHRLKKLRSRTRKFQLKLYPTRITEEVEQLYARYRASINFDGNDSVSSCLLGFSNHDFFPGRMWEIRDGEKLIAAGYFDEGQESCAGILNFFDPDYRKYSLGLLLYFESVAFAAHNGKTFFYPGYIGVGYPKFDYKLEVGADRIELWHPRLMCWLPYFPETLEIISEDNGKNIL
ncbi:MAG: GNAT family N-acetyltransferase [Chitinophagaceae bacterium]